MNRSKVLLVEDNRLLRWWLMIDLYDAGYFVAGPDTIEEAIHWAGSMSFEVLITDWRLPVGHDGFEMLERVRAKSPDILPILMSAEVDDELAQQAHEIGFRCVLTKPFSPGQLLEALRTVTQGAAAPEPARLEVVA